MATKTKKEPIELATQIDPKETSSSTYDFTTEKPDVSIDYSETQLFKADGSYNKALENQTKGYHWLFVVYPESAPSDWEEKLEQTGLAFARSPLHDKDINQDGSPKKAHIHVIVSYSSNTTYSNICGLREITKGPYPLKCGSVAGSYAYFTHRNNPEKAQYLPEGIKRFNGWEKTLESNEVNAIKKELTETIFLEEITDYAELIAIVSFMDGDYQNVAMNNTVYFDRLCASYRHNRIGTLIRYYNSVPDGEKKDRVGEMLGNLQGLHRDENI